MSTMAGRFVLHLGVSGPKTYCGLLRVASGGRAEVLMPNDRLDFSERLCSRCATIRDMRLREVKYAHSEHLEEK